VKPPSPDATGGSGGGTVSSGGAGLGGMQEIITSTELRVGDTGGAVAQAGSAGSGPDIGCDMSALEKAIATSVGLPECTISGSSWLPPKSQTLQGHLDINEEGRIVYTGRTDVDALTAQGWACSQYAGMRLTYECVTGYGV